MIRTEPVKIVEYAPDSCATGTQQEHNVKTCPESKLAPQTVKKTDKGTGMCFYCMY